MNTITEGVWPPANALIPSAAASARSNQWKGIDYEVVEVDGTFFVTVRGDDIGTAASKMHGTELARQRINRSLGAKRASRTAPLGDDEYFDAIRARLVEV